MWDVDEVKRQLVQFGEAEGKDFYLSDEDLSVDYIVTMQHDDEWCFHLLHAILGDSDSAKFISESLDKHIETMYYNGKITPLEDL